MFRVGSGLSFAWSSGGLWVGVTWLRVGFG